MSINSQSNFKILKDYAKRLDTNHRNDIATSVKTDTIEGIEGAAVIINGITVDSGALTVDQLLTDAVTTSSGAGAVGLTGGVHEITTTGTGNALTLADGVLGQHLIVVYVAEAGGTDTAILTPTTLLGANTTITFTDLGDSAHLLFTSAGWTFVGGEAVVA